jgi:hypothetical protein
VEGFGVIAGEQAVTSHGVFVDTDQSAGLANAAPLLDVSQQRDDFLFRQRRAEEWRAFAFGETLLAGGTIQHAALFVGAVVIANGQVACAAIAVVGTVGVLATEPQ